MKSVCKIFQFIVHKVIKNSNEHKRFFLGIPYYNKQKNQIGIIYKYCGIPLFKVVTKDNYKYFYVINFLIRKAQRKLSLMEENYNLFKMMMLSIECSKINGKAFGDYKNKYAGKDIVIVATGPTLNFYSQIDEAIHIGCNKSFLCDFIKLDYLFIQDYSGTKEYFHYLKSLDIPIFLGKYLFDFYEKLNIPESVVNELQNVKKYCTAAPYQTDYKINIDIQPLTDDKTIVHYALQFALFCNPKRIFLVGCDTTHFGYYDKSKRKNNLDIESVILGYKKIKDFAIKNYPATQIISINPVGLKNIFIDVYTESFLQENDSGKNISYLTLSDFLGREDNA